MAWAPSCWGLSGAPARAGNAPSVEAPPSAGASFRKPRRPKSFRKVILFPSPFVLLRLLSYSGGQSGACIVRMSLMRDAHLRNLDLNLIHPLHALLEECHVTRAANRSFLSQSAMSRALDRLRDMFGDPLLVRNGRGYQRTVRGERVLRDLESLMPQLENMVRGEKFNPAQSQE